MTYRLRHTLTNQLGWWRFDSYEEAKTTWEQLTLQGIRNTWTIERID